MPASYQNDQEPLVGRESLFRQKLIQLRNTGEIQRATINSRNSGFKTIEQSQYLSNVSTFFEHTDRGQLENLALLDTLTELYNHNTLCRVLNDELRRAHRYNNPLSLLAITIDVLPQLVDRADAFAFDAVLKAVAQFLMRSVRDVDIPGRYDLDRLMILCPETNLDGALVLAGRLCTNIENEDFLHTGSNARVTLSIGLATFPDLAENCEQLLQLSMQALSMAKQSGGNTFKIGATA